MKFSKADEIIFQNIFLLRKKRQFGKALKLLDSLEFKYKNNKIIHGLYAIIFYEAKDFKNSAIHYGKVITIKPNSELASLGLYMSLIHLGKHRKALKELFRYTEISEPKLYIVTIKELMEENIDTIGFNTDKIKIQSLYKKWCLTYDAITSSKSKVATGVRVSSG